jgi:hypothetical protein
MNHDPKEHFSEAQLDIVTEIFHGEINKMLVKIVGANLVVVFLGISAVGAGWYRLGNVESNLATVNKTLNEGPRFTQDEGDALQAQLNTEVENLQRQIDGNNSRLDRIENKIDIILDRL